MTRSLLLADHASRDDLRIYLERLEHAGRPEVRLVARGAVLAVFGCTQAPESILDQVPVVLGLRSFALRGDDDDTEDHAAPVCDLVVSARALLDRIARLGRIGLELELPDSDLTAAWAGVLPPVHGWEAAGVLDAASLATVAAEGMSRITAALPESPGDAIVRKVRREVWGSEIAPGLPAAAAFALEALGFLGTPAPGDTVRMSSTLTWRRLSTPRGEVLIRKLMG